MSKPTILVYASGTAVDGGSGFEKLVLASRNGILDAEIIGVVSNYPEGGVYKRANELGVPFYHFPKPWKGLGYQYWARKTGADFFALSGWMQLVCGLDPATRFNSKTVFNIHPGPLDTFGGPGMYGHHVNEDVITAYKRGEIKHSAVCMHFVTEPKSKDDYDKGPPFFWWNVKIEDDYTPSTLKDAVNKWEHHFQPKITNMVVNGAITWDGINPESLVLPSQLYKMWAMNIRR